MRKCEFCDKEHEMYWTIKGIRHLLCLEHYEALEEQVKRNDLVKKTFDVAKDTIV